MDCQEAIKNMPAFLSGGTGAGEVDAMLEHVSRCRSCSSELRVYEDSWKTLGTWQDMDPDPGYVPRFWTRLARETPWHEKTWTVLRPVLLPGRVVPAFVTLCSIFILAQVTVSQIRIQQTERLLTSLSRDDMEFMQNIDLIEHLDLLENMDVLKDFDVVSALTGPGT